MRRFIEQNFYLEQELISLIILIFLPHCQRIKLQECKSVLVLARHKDFYHALKGFLNLLCSKKVWALAFQYFNPAKKSRQSSFRIYHNIQGSLWKQQLVLSNQVTCFMSYMLNLPISSETEPKRRSIFENPNGTVCIFFFIFHLYDVLSHLLYMSTFRSLEIKSVRKDWFCTVKGD